MIDLKEVRKIFNAGKANEVIALKPLSLHIAAGEFVVVVGANGSGKSTLLNLIAGSSLPSAGTIYIDGKQVTRLPDYRRSRWIARVFQNPLSGTAEELTILDNFRLAALRTQSKNLKIGVDAAFRNQVKKKVSLLKMGLETKVDQPIGSLSGGQRQALTLLMSIMDDCKILLLDEPSAALDPRSADTVMQTASHLIKEFKLTAVLITHNLKDAFTYGDRLLHMNEGSIIKDINAVEKQRLTQNDLFYWFG